MQFRTQMLDNSNKGNGSLSTAPRSFGTLIRYQHTLEISSLVATFVSCQPEDSS